VPHRLDAEALATASLSDVGRSRSENQDACGDFVHPSRTSRLLVLADGMGGHRGGALASDRCIGAFARVFKDRGESPESQLARAFELANDEIHRAASADERLRGMGTTGVALLFSDDARATLGWAGDSRAYRWRRGEFEQLTRDHSMVAEWIRQGVISEAEAENHPRRSELTRAIGIDPQLEPEFLSFEVEPGDRFLLCSDGLSGMVRDEEIGSILGGEDPDRAVLTLVARANALGGHDNITIQIAAVPAELAAAAETAPEQEPGRGAAEEADAEPTPVKDPEPEESALPAEFEPPSASAPPTPREAPAAPEPPLAGAAEPEPEPELEPEQVPTPAPAAMRSPGPLSAAPLAPEFVYVSVPRKFNGPSAAVGAAFAAILLILGQYAFTQLDSDLRRVQAYEAGPQPGNTVIRSHDRNALLVLEEPLALPEPAIPPTAGPTTPPGASDWAEIQTGVALAAQAAPASGAGARSAPASAARGAPQALLREVPNAEGFAVPPDVRRFVDGWLRAIATVDFQGYHALGFPDSASSFARTHTGHDSHRLEDLSIEPGRGGSEQIFLEARLSYVFEDERGRWRTDDRHRLVLRHTAEGLRYEGRWK
jgi:protein phosphatase